MNKNISSCERTSVGDELGEEEEEGGEMVKPHRDYSTPTGRRNGGSSRHHQQKISRNLAAGALKPNGATPDVTFTNSVMYVRQGDRGESI